MPRMTFKLQGFHNADESEVESLKAEGWSIITDSEWKAIIKQKLGINEEHNANANEPVDVKQRRTILRVRNGNSTNDC